MWDLLLFNPSPQHTAALCLQRQGSSAAEVSCSSEEGCDIAWEGDEVISHADSAHSMASGRTDDSSKRMFGSTAAGVTLRCWRTVPLVREALMDQDDCVVLGCS